jgi:hypothetical protein
MNLEPIILSTITVIDPTGEAYRTNITIKGNQVTFGYPVPWCIHEFKFEHLRRFAFIPAKAKYPILRDQWFHGVYVDELCRIKGLKSYT